MNQEIEICGGGGGFCIWYCKVVNNQYPESVVPLSLAAA